MLRKNIHRFYFLLISLICFFFIACTKNDALQNIDLPADTAMNDANRYALIIETYVSLLDKPGDDGITISHARRLDVFPIKGLKIVKKNKEQILWLDVGGGWVKRSDVQLYSSKAKVLNAAQNLKNK